MAAPVLRRRARERLGPVIAHTYGASDMGIVSAVSPAEHDRPSRFRCAGRIRAGVDVRFRRPDGTLHPRAGAIEVRSPAMAQGYRHRPVEEAEHFVDGWYVTGDLGALDDEDMLRILGRVTDVDAFGESPVDLQDALCSTPSVRYAVLLADPEHDLRIAAVEAWPGDAVDVERCRDALAGRAVALLPVDRMHLTEQGKPNRPALRAMALDQVRSTSSV
jgi:fatty-acyl-CoA synthase